MGTPRKIKQQAVITRQRKQLFRLKQAQSKTNKKQNNKKQNKRKDTSTLVNQLKSLLPERIVKFIEMQIDLHAKKSKGRRYSKELKAFALSLYHVSGKAYRLVSKLFHLPSKVSLLSWVSRLSKFPGLTDAAMKVIKSKVRLMSEMGRLCSLCLDEISLKTKLMYDISCDEVIGFESYGEGQKSYVITTFAIVVMAHGITDNWKQPLGYFFVHESCSSAQVKNIIEDAIQKVQTIGLKVVCIVTDLGSNFQQLARVLGVTPN